MDRFSKVLFVSDRSKGEISALHKTMELANHYGATVTIVDVIPDYSAEYVFPEARSADSPLRRALEEDCRKHHQELLRKIKPVLSAAARRIRVDTVVREGIDYVEIIREVRDGGYDLLTKAANDNASFGARLFGTLDLQLVRKCPCPVLVLKRRKKIDHGRILAAVDLNRTTKSRENLDRVVMDMASSMAGMEEATLDVIHAWHMPYEKKLRNEERVGLYRSLDQMSRELREVEKKHLQELATDYAYLTPVTHLVKGRPEVVIPHFVDSHRIDLVVMGTVGRTGMAGFFVGNTAEKTLHALNCSVLALKPQGYKSPVK